MNNTVEFTTSAAYRQSPSESAKGLMVCDAIAKTNGAFNAAEAAKMGITCNVAKWASCIANDAVFKQEIEAYAKDAGFELGDANIDALGTFFLVWNEKVINRLYRGRTMAKNFTINTIGDWLTQKIIFKMRELTSANVGRYGDFSRPSFQSYNRGYDTRDTLQTEIGLEVTYREEAVAAVMRYSAYQEKKDAMLLRMEMWDNDFFAKGASIPGKKLYGILNETNLRAAQDLPVDFASDSITPTQVAAVFRMIKQKMADDLKGAGEDIETLKVEIKMPIKWQTALTAVSDDTVIGWTANKWLAENWKNASISFMPELDDADEGEPMMIVIAPTIQDVGMDSFFLARTSALRLVGAQPMLKGREEAYSSSVAGALCACPQAVQFWTAGGASSGS